MALIPNPLHTYTERNRAANVCLVARKILALASHERIFLSIQAFRLIYPVTPPHGKPASTSASLTSHGKTVSPLGSGRIIRGHWFKGDALKPSGLDCS